MHPTCLKVIIIRTFSFYVEGSWGHQDLSKISVIVRDILTNMGNEKSELLSLDFELLKLTLRYLNYLIRNTSGRVHQKKHLSLFIYRHFKTSKNLSFSKGVMVSLRINFITKRTRAGRLRRCTVRQIFGMMVQNDSMRYIWTYIYISW